MRAHDVDHAPLSVRIEKRQAVLVLVPLQPGHDAQPPVERRKDLGVDAIDLGAQLAQNTVGVFGHV